MIPVDGCAAVPYPSSIGELHVEAETGRRAEEQLLLHRAEGTVEARTARLTIGELDSDVSDLAARIGRYQTLVATAQQRLGLTNETLAHLVRRPHGAHRLFFIRKALIFTGDVVGVSASLINFGLLPWMALIQGLSIGGAVVTLGQVGTELKHMQRARELQRPEEELTEDQRHFAHLFAGPSGGESIAKVVFSITAAALLLIFGGVLSVQWATDGLAAGLFFGCLGAAIGLASIVNYWAFADQVADIVDNAKADYAEADAQLAALSDSPIRRAHGKASAELASITEESELRAKAGAARLQALGKKTCWATTRVWPATAPQR